MYALAAKTVLSAETLQAGTQLKDGALASVSLDVNARGHIIQQNTSVNGDTAASSLQFSRPDGSLAANNGSTPPSSNGEDKTNANNGDSSTPQPSLRYPARSKRAACPLCNKFFFDLNGHAATCKLEEDSPKPTATEPAGKKKKSRSANMGAQQSATVSTPNTDMRKKKPVEDPTLTFLQSNLLPPPPQPSPPEDEANRKVIERERALLAAAAKAAANFEGSSRPELVELVEIEHGVTILTSETPFRDGLGQGIAFTLRSELVNMMAELHAVRESESQTRAENDKLRSLVEEVKTRAAQAHIEFTEGLARDREFFTSEAAQAKEAATHAHNLLSETKKALEAKEKELAKLSQEAEESTKTLQETSSALEEKVKSAEKEAKELRTKLEKSEKQVTKLSEELKTTKAALETAESSISNLRNELDSAKNEAYLKTMELDDLKREMDVGQSIAGSIAGSTFFPFDNQIATQPVVAPADVDEYLELLKLWLSTHNNSIPVSALAIFHGTKSQAEKLWTRIAPLLPFRDLVMRHGASKGVVLSGDESTVSLVPVRQVSPAQQVDHSAAVDSMMLLPPLGMDEALLPEDLLGMPMDTRTLSTEETSLMERVASWLEEKNGHASWAEFRETFPSYQGTSQELQELAAAYQDAFFVTQSEDLVLTSMAERVLATQFASYLRAQGGMAPASRYAHFIETTPGVLQIRQRLAQADSKLAALSKKFPDKIHFWREGDNAMCCVAEERPRIEREKAEKKRQEEEARMDQEKRRLEKEKSEAEERARLDWEQRKKAIATASSSVPSVSAPPTAASSANTTAPPKKISRWASSSSDQPQQQTVVATSASAGYSNNNSSNGGYAQSAAAAVPAQYDPASAPYDPSLAPYPGPNPGSHQSAPSSSSYGGYGGGGGMPPTAPVGNVHGGYGPQPDRYPQVPGPHGYDYGGNNGGGAYLYPGHVPAAHQQHPPPPSNQSIQRLVPPSNPQGYHHPPQQQPFYGSHGPPPPHVPYPQQPPPPSSMHPGSSSQQQSSTKPPSLLRYAGKRN